MIVPAPPASIRSINSYNLPAGAVLHRLHDEAFAGTAFNPCQGRPSRFAPITDRHGNCVPSLYAAESKEAATFETAFHDVDPHAAYKVVRLADVESRAYSPLCATRALKLVQLFAPDLKAWNLTRAALIDTAAAHYRATARWAKAIHHQFPDIDGLVWTSRQCDPQCAYLLFGDRVRASDVAPGGATVKARDSAELLEELRAFGKRAGITITI